MQGQTGYGRILAFTLTEMGKHGQMSSRGVTESNVDFNSITVVLRREYRGKAITGIPLSKLLKQSLERGQ